MVAPEAMKEPGRPPRRPPPPLPARSPPLRRSSPGDGSRRRRRAGNHRWGPASFFFPPKLHQLYQNLFSEKENGYREEEGDQDGRGIRHVPEERGHLHTAVLGDGFDHEIGPVTDVSVGANEHR